MENPQLTCGKCKTQFTAQPPQPQTMAAPNLSMVYITYEHGVECPACGAYFVPIITGAQVTLNWAQIDKPKDAPLVVAPPPDFENTGPFRK